MATEFRHDSFYAEVADKLDENGFLTLKAKPTRAGVFTYKDKDGNIVRELRHPDDVFDSESMKSLALKPFTMLHEGGMVTPETFKSQTHGTTGENITRTSDDYLGCNISVQDKLAIKTIIELNKPKLSAGYRCDIIKESGEYNGVRYDQKQTNIKYNHVTGGLSAGQARGGDGCEFRFDDASILIEEIIEEDSMEKIKKEIPALDVGAGENAVRLDSLVIEETPENLKLLGQRSQLVTALKGSQSRLDRVEGERDQLKADKEKLEADTKDMIPAERFDSAVREGMELLKMADEIGLEGRDKIKSNKEFKKAICLKFHPELDKERLDSEEYLDGRFDPIKEDWKQKSSNINTRRSIELFEKGGGVNNKFPDQTGAIDYAPSN